MNELVITGTAEGADGSSAGLARLLVSFERSLSAEPPDRVLLADDSDAALAAALVATKLLIRGQIRGRSAATSTNGRLIAQLAGAARRRRRRIGT